MRTSSDTLAHDFQATDYRLVSYHHGPDQQRAVRLLMAVVATGYALVAPYAPFPELPWSALAIALIPCLYAIVQFLLSVIENARGHNVTLSVLITALDGLLLTLWIGFDPSASTPTLVMLALAFGLAGWRWGPRQLLLTTVLFATGSIGALATRALLQPDVFSMALAASAALLLVLLLLIHFYQQQAMDLQLQTQSIPSIDPETGLCSRSTLYAAAQILWPYLMRQQAPVSLLYAVIEPNGTKPGSRVSNQQADTLAHAFAEVSADRLRASDLLVRYSPLEFVFVLLDCPSAQAEPIALQLQERFHQRMATDGDSAMVYFSATWLPSEPIALDQLLQAMDAALIRARRSRGGVSGAVYTDPEQARQGHQL